MDLAKPNFAVFGTLTKARTDEQGDMFVWGPVSTEREDYDGQVLEKAGILKGLETHEQLGGHVDYGHQYRQRLAAGDPDAIKWLIGRRSQLREIDGSPCMEVKLYKSSDLAQEVYRKVNDGCPMGFSIDGVATSQSKDGKRVHDTKIHLVTVDPMPKNYDCKIFGGLMPLAKAVENGDFDGDAPGHEDPVTVHPDAEGVSRYLDGAHDTHHLHHAALRDRYLASGNKDRAEFHHGTVTGLHVAKDHIQGGKSVEEMHERGREMAEQHRVMDEDASPMLKGFHHGCKLMHHATKRAMGEPVSKALTVGSGIVHAGDTGGATLRTQDIGPVERAGWTCSECHARNGSRRETCRACGAHKGYEEVRIGKGASSDGEHHHIGFDALVKKLMDEHGYDEETAKKIAASIGRKKFGSAGMERRAEAGRAAAKGLADGTEETEGPRIRRISIRRAEGGPLVRRIPEAA